MRFIPTRMGNTRALPIVRYSAPVHPHTHGEHVSPGSRFSMIVGSSPHAWGTPLDLNPEGLVGPVHPHTHGEHSLVSCNNPTVNGSSPHAWGTPRSWCRLPDMDRFIPTRMGNTIGYASNAMDIPVHPHTHGEHICKLYQEVGHTGSSPHAWGTRALSARDTWRMRFIPTRMGNTRALPIVRYSAPVHPHTHGEHVSPGSRFSMIVGSSPHAWGTPLDLNPEGLVGPVHPHTHGEHSLVSCNNPTVNGSSPHAWGTPRSWCRLPDMDRFIPTRMGNTIGYASNAMDIPVHPHTHGEHICKLYQEVGHTGSSPHAWGTQTRVVHRRRPYRFIPTRMGNTPRQ